MRNMDISRLALALCLGLTLAACGGGDSDDGGDDNSGGGDDSGGGGDSGGGNEKTHIPANAVDSYVGADMADIDNDGDVDLILAVMKEDVSREYLLLNDGDAYFTADLNTMPEYSEVGHTVAIVTEDFTGNGYQDILTVTVDARPEYENFYSQSWLHLYHNNGDGSFTDASDRISDNHLEEEWPEWIRVADFDDDGLADFMLTKPGCYIAPCYGGRIYLNNGTGGFAPATITMIDEIGEYVDTELWWDGAQNWDGSFGNRNRREMLDAFVGDLNGNGLPDVFSGGLQTTWATFVNVSTPGELRFEVVFSGGLVTEHPPEECPPEHDPADGNCEILDPYDSEIVFKNGALADLDGDGDPDVLVSEAIAGSVHERQPVYVLINDGNGHFDYVGVAGTVSAGRSESPEGPFTISDYPDDTGVTHARQWLTADFNGDGLDDLYIADHGYEGGGEGAFTGAPNLLLLNNGDGTLTDASSDWLATLSTYTHGAAVGDVTGNGSPDVFTNNGEGENLSRGKLLHLNKGSAPLESVD